MWAGLALSFACGFSRFSVCFCMTVATRLSLVPVIASLSPLLRMLHGRIIVLLHGSRSSMDFSGLRPSTLPSWCFHVFSSARFVFWHFRFPSSVSRTSVLNAHGFWHLLIVVHSVCGVNARGPAVFNICSFRRRRLRVLPAIP